MTLMKSMALVAAVALGGSAASAATCNSPVGTNAVTYTLTQGVPDKVTDVGCFAGNDKNSVSGTIFGVTGWTLGGATDGGGTGLASISLAGQAWSLAGTVFEHMMVALKQSDSYALFKLDTSEGLSGLWGTAGPAASINDLSHASIWYAGSRVVTPPPPPPSAVPLPAGGLLLLSALGGLAIARRRKKV